MEENKKIAALHKEWRRLVSFANDAQFAATAIGVEPTAELSHATHIAREASHAAWIAYRDATSRESLQCFGVKV